MSAYVIGADKYIRWDLKRAAVEREDGQIDLYTLAQHADNEAMGLHVGRIPGPMVQGEHWVKTGEMPPEAVKPGIWTPGGVI